MNDDSVMMNGGKVWLFWVTFFCVAPSMGLVASGQTESTSSLCEAGWAGAYPCERVDLMGQLTNAEMNGTGGNDLWGWYDEANEMEYALVGQRNGLAIVDVTDPYNPTLTAFLPTETSASTWRDMKVIGHHVFVVSEAIGHGLQVYDLTELAALASTPAMIEPTAVHTGFSDAHNIVVNAASGMGYAVGTNLAGGGLVIFDLNDPENPVLVGDYAEAGYCHDAQVVNYDGPDVEHVGKEMAFAANAQHWTVLDVTDPTDVSMVGYSNYASSGYVHQCWLSEDHRFLFLGDELDEMNFGNTTRTLIWNVEDLDNPVLIGEHLAETPSIDHNQYVQGNLLFQSNYTAGLRILALDNVADGELEEVAHFDVYPSNDNANFHGAWSVYPFLPSGLVLISSIDDGLFVVRPRFMTAEAQGDEICQSESMEVTVEVLPGLLPPYNLSLVDLPDGLEVSGLPATLQEPGMLTFSLSGFENLNGELNVVVRLETASNVVEEEISFEVNQEVNWYSDLDGDGYGNPLSPEVGCGDLSGLAGNGLDCDDSSALVFPTAEELCDNVDNNCNDLIDEGLVLTTWFFDGDQDGFGSETNTVTTCVVPLSYVAVGGDCLDTDATVYPGASGTAAGLDNNCSDSLEPAELNPCPGDFNYDAYVSVIDLLLLLQFFGCETVCNTDMDGNGTVAVQDLLSFLQYFSIDCL